MSSSFWTKRGEKTATLDLSGTFEKEVDKLENQLKEYLDKKVSFDDQISNRCAQIVELTKEIESLEKQNDDLEWDKSLPTR